MNTSTEELVKQAKQSFERTLANQIYSNIIKDDKHLELLLSMVKLPPDGHLLDIGTGTGYLAFPLAKLYPQCQVTGIDIAENIVEMNTQKATEEALTNLHFQAFDGITYPFAPESIDYMTTRYALHHFPDIKGAVKQLAAILKPGGNILISDPMRHPKDTHRVIDKFMSLKPDGHIGFYLPTELDTIFAENHMFANQSIITQMTFPFPIKPEYMDLYNRLTDDEKEMYQIYAKNDTVFVGSIDVGNIVYTKRI